MKTIFHKFAFIYILIFLISFILIIIGVRSVLDYYFVSNESNLITQRAHNFEEIVNSRYFNSFSLDLLQEQIMLLDGYTGANIWLFTEEGAFYSTSDSTYDMQPGKYPYLDDDIKSVFEGHETSREVSYEGISQDRILRVGLSFSCR